MHARMISVVVFSAVRLQVAATAAGRMYGYRSIQPNSARPSSVSHAWVAVIRKRAHSHSERLKQVLHVGRNSQIHYIQYGGRGGRGRVDFQLAVRFTHRVLRSSIDRRMHLVPLGIRYCGCIESCNYYSCIHSTCMMKMAKCAQYSTVQYSTARTMHVWTAPYIQNVWGPIHFVWGPIHLVGVMHGLVGCFTANSQMELGSNMRSA